MTLRPLGLQSLSIVASVLSDEYGVQVLSGGTEAFTAYPLNGKPVINIPAVDVQDQDYLTMVRGFIDHETGHIRFTRPVPGISGPAYRAREKSEKPKAVTVIFNIYEDVYVERMMGQCFPGCRRNISQLVRLLYVARRQPPLNVYEFIALQAQIPMADVAETVWSAIFQYITYFVRSQEQPELERLVPEYRGVLDHLVPGHAAELEPVMRRVKTEGSSTEANARRAEKSLAIILTYFQDHSNVMEGGLQEEGEEGEEQSDGKSGNAAGEGKAKDARASELQQALEDQVENCSAGEKAGVDISRQTAEKLSEMVEDSGLAQPEQYQTIDPGTHAWKAQIEPLEQSDIDAAARVTAYLDAQLQSLVQTFIMNREGLARAGKLDTNVLHRLATSNPRVFRRQVEKRGINTEIVLIADMSGSMVEKEKDIIASRALYAIMSSLRKISGVTSRVVAFSGNKMFDILRPDDPLTTFMRLRATGHTLCGEALSYAMHNFSGSLDSRKIIFMLTDSEADNENYFKDIIQHTKAVGVEFLGIGIMDDAILHYLPREDCCVIKDLNRLAPEMFRMLRNKLLGAA